MKTATLKTKYSFKIAAIVTAATVGDGVFALPYVFHESGWLLGIFYLAALAAIIVVAHVVYFQTLEKVGEKERLLGLARKYLGTGGFWVGFAAIVFGLLLTLVAYLILGTQFIRLAVPSLPPIEALLAFWAFISLPVFLGDGRVVKLELLGITCTSLIIISIFASAFPNVVFQGTTVFNPQNLFLPFGVVLFSLAGWTGIEPAYESRKGSRRAKSPFAAIATGTIFAALLYLMFAAGIIGSAPHIAPDTISGLADWPLWKRDILAVLGILAVSTVFMPISRELRNALEKDLRWNKVSSRALIIFFPIICFALGLNNFLTVVGIVGGLFLSTQYLLIVSVGRRVLKLSFIKKFLLDIVALIFIAAAVYQLFTFVVQ